MSMIRRRTAAQLMLAGLASSTAWAQDRPVIGIVSLVGDFLTVTGFESTTGSRLALNQTERIDLVDDSLERTVLRAAMKAVQEKGQAKAVPLLINDGAIYRDQKRLGQDDEATIPASLLQTLKGQGATRLLVVTKWRGDARMQAADSTLGTGTVEGLGFYVDRVTTLRLTETSKTAVGYIAPHAYLHVALIDVATRKVLGARRLTASRVISASQTDADGADPWGILDTAGKMAELKSLIDKGLPGLVSEVLAS
jgi:hypothetical protein